MKSIRRCTLLELVRAVQDSTSSDAEAVTVIAALINNGQVVLRGTFAGTRIVQA